LGAIIDTLPELAEPVPRWNLTAIKLSLKTPALVSEACFGRGRNAPNKASFVPQNHANLMAVRRNLGASANYPLFRISPQQIRPYRPLQAFQICRGTELLQGPFRLGQTTDDVQLLGHVAMAFLCKKGLQVAAMPFP